MNRARSLAALAALALRTPPAAAQERAVDGPPVLKRGDAARRRLWLQLHAAYVREAARGTTRIAFYGDSLTFGWAAEGRRIFDASYLPLDAAQFGIGGDRTDDLQWRIEHGEAVVPPPRAIVVMIGTNELERRARAVTEGIVACVDALRARAPEAQILVLGLLPRGRGGRNDPLRREIATINTALSELNARPRTHVLDMSPAYLTFEGSVDMRYYQRDALHLSPAGYALWARTMSPVLDELLALA